MVYKSKYSNVDSPKSGFLQFIFDNKYNVPEDKPLLIDALDTNRFLNFSQIKKYTLQFAAGLQDICHFKKDDVLAIYSPNQYNYSIPVYGAIAADGATTTVNPHYNVEELYYQLSLTKAKVLICHRENIETALVAGARAGIDKANMFVFGDQEVKGIQPFQKVLIGGEREVTLEELTYEQYQEKIAWLCFSSGTSGRSKGVMTTHANLTANISQYAEFDKTYLNSGDNRMLAVMPFYHLYGLLVSLNYGLYFGIPIYILQRFDIVSFCKTIQDQKITLCSIVPPICLLLSKHDIVSKYDLSSLKFVFCGAAPLGAELSKETTDRIPTLIIRQLYGLTETCITMIQPFDNVIDGCIGSLFPNMTAKIVDDDGNEEVNYGECGELWLKGPNIMKGYFKNPTATNDCIDNEGYFHTGDIARVDKDGNFYIVDRKKELIKYKGYQVAPAEIEGILLTNPIIADCAVIGIYDAAQATETPRAYVTLKDQSKASEETAKLIMKHVSDQVVNYKQVRSIRFIPSIPKNPSGKILRRVLRDIAAQEKEIISPKL